MTAPNRTAGFTLIEMMVVLVVMGLLLGLVLARGPERSPTLTLRAVASTIAQELRLARTEAIAADQPVRFVLDPARHGYSVGNKSYFLPPEVAATAPRGGIVFMPDGSASPGTVILALGQMRKAITVNWLTGRVSLG